MSYQRRFRSFTGAVMQRVALLVYPGYSVIALAVVGVFEVANMMRNEEVYDVRFISESGGPIRISSGMTLHSEPFSDEPFDTLMVGGARMAGGPSVPKPTPELIEFGRRVPATGRRVPDICSGE